MGMGRWGGGSGRGGEGRGGDSGRRRINGSANAPRLVRVTFGVHFAEVPVECLLRCKDEPMKVPSVRWVAQDAAAVHRQRRNPSSDGLTGEILLFKDSVAHIVIRDKKEDH